MKGVRENGWIGRSVLEEVVFPFGKPISTKFDGFIFRHKFGEQWHPQFGEGVASDLVASKGQRTEQSLDIDKVDQLMSFGVGQHHSQMRKRRVMVQEARVGVGTKFSDVIHNG